ncbi:unnamed protein product [Parnassius apollo]|uniref:(apollo) hypothetical protein n=1 Tax=Parnassius apollo TaxID=110799 RepID=A0A8S3XKQ8_PARAO|nr:unnamed protein product [Parnassius apollo]
MPLNRSTPINPSTSRSPSLQHCDSEPNLKSTESEAYINTAVRKRKFCKNLSDEFSAIYDKFTDMFMSVKSEQDSKLSKILHYFCNIKQQNDDIRESIMFMSKKYDTLLSSVQSLQEENKAYRKRIEILGEKNLRA